VTENAGDGAAARHSGAETSDDDAAPGSAPGSGDRDAAARSVAGESSEAATGEETEASGGFGRRGWVLVCVVVLSTLVIPGIIYLVPALLPSLGVPYLLALLVLPLVPAGLLGATAVWSMAASGRR
jgi:hypothetical protein